MTFLLMCEGAEKCALRHLRRAEEMESLNFILHTRTGMQMAVSTPHTAKSTNALRASHVRRAMSSIHGWHAAASFATAFLSLRRTHPRFYHRTCSHGDLSRAASFFYHCMA